MDVFETLFALEHIEMIVDTREQNTERAKKRLQAVGYHYIREKLDFADYSAKCYLQNGTVIDFTDKFAIERKMHLDELCHCFCHDRKRFEREFDRAKNKNAKVYMLIENADFEKAYNGKYRSKMKPQALTASMIAWLARYNCQLIFCREETSGKLIHDIIYREIKERLENGECDEL